MQRRDVAELFALAALWGAAFLFMRIGAADFGPAALAFLRVTGAALVLLPWLAWRGGWSALRRHWRAIAVVGLFNSALPFGFLMVAALVLTAGLSAIFNATAPLWAALVAWAWFGQRPGALRGLGLAIGFAGVLGLGWHDAGIRPDAHGVSAALGIACCIAATACYGFSANFTKRHLGDAPPLAVAAGSQLFASLLTLAPALWWWPAQTPGPAAWAAAAVLAVACTGLAYVLFFRLIAHAGPANAIAVTFLIPGFAVLWGGLFLGEALTASTALGCAVILLGTALATGLLRRRAASALPGQA